MSEIKLGWYKSKQDVVSLFDPVEVVYFDKLQVVHTTKNCGLKIEDSKRFAQYRDYIGTELGEWVSADDVKLSELPVLRARFRNDQESWKEGVLDGRFVDTSEDYPSTYSCKHGPWYKQCQVWRAMK